MQCRQRCEQLHGTLCCEVINSRVPAKNGKLKNYTCGDFDYDLCSKWCITTADPPPPLQPSGAAFIVTSDDWVQTAEADAVHPVVDYLDTPR